MAPDPLVKASFLLGVAAVLVFAAVGLEAAPMIKCIVNGTVTYQQVPCPAEQAGKRPTLEELNAEARRRRAEAASAPSDRAPSAPASVPSAGAFSCDGRTRCSQMKSCAEAKYFLAHCPGVEMDGDKNGIPCEKQWCNR